MELKQGQKVIYHIGDLSGTAKIVGKAVVDLPVIGTTYILEPYRNIRSEVYNYSHLVANETQFDVIEDDIDDVKDKFTQQEVVELVTDLVESDFLDFTQKYGIKGWDKLNEWIKYRIFDGMDQS